MDNAVARAAAIVVFAGIAACGADPITLPVTPSPVTSSPGPAFVPPPTYRLDMGILTINMPCSGCLVEITSGPGAGLSLTTARGGQAAFGIPEPGGVVTVRASKDNYRPTTTTLTVNGSSNIGELSLQPNAPLVDLVGARSVEVRADAACANGLPAEFRVRTYPVSLVKENPNIFRAQPPHEGFSRFVMQVFALVEEVWFAIDNWEPEGPGIIEPLPNGTTLQIDLWSWEVPVSNPDSISTPIGGTISICDASNKCTAVCRSNTHQLTLTRR